MSRKIKLIWDFRGLDAKDTAKHHDLHLKDYSNTSSVIIIETGYENLNEMHAIAYMVVNENDMFTIRDILKPHRAEVF